MKKTIFLIIVLTVLVVCVWLLLRQPMGQPSNQNVEPPIQVQETNTTHKLTASLPPSGMVPATTNAFVRPDYIEEEQWNRLMLIRQLALEQNQPVEFYVRVLDQDDRPVEGARLKITLSRINEKIFETTNFFSMKMGDEILHQPLEFSSDPAGWVRVTNFSGDSLWIEDLTKDGYSCKLPNIGSFSYEPHGQRRVGYAGMEDAFDPDKGYVFHLQKIEDK